LVIFFGIKNNGFAAGAALCDDFIDFFVSVAAREKFLLLARGKFYLRRVAEL